MPVRVLLGKISAEWMAILADLIRSDARLEIVGVLESPLDVLLRAKELSADVVVLSQLRDGGEPGICSHFLLEYPNVALVLLPPSPGANVLLRLVLRKQTFGGASRTSLHSALTAGLAATDPS
jgi:hypothetical protein